MLGLSFRRCLCYLLRSILILALGLFSLIWLIQMEVPNFFYAPVKIKPLSKTLLVISSPEIKSALSPLIQLRELQGFKVEWHPVSVLQSEEMLVGSKNFSYALIVGNAFISPASAYFAPTCEIKQSTVFARLNFSSKVPTGPIKNKYYSDAALLKERGYKISSVGRWPVHNGFQLKNILSRQMEYEHAFQPGRSLLLMAENMHFSKEADQLIEGFGRLIVQNTQNAGFSSKVVFSDKDKKTSGISLLDQPWGVSVFAGGGSRNELGDFMNLKEVERLPLTKTSGPMFVFSARTGMGRDREISSAIFNQRHGPVALQFNSALNHPLTDALYARGLNEKMKTRPQTLGEWLHRSRQGMRERSLFEMFAEFSTWALTGLRAAEIKKFTNDKSLDSMNLYGDPSQPLKL